MQGSSLLERAGSEHGFAVEVVALLVFETLTGLANYLLPFSVSNQMMVLLHTAVGFVLIGFLALFAFFDLIGELRDLGNGNYHLQQIFSVVLFWVPAHAYELFPVAVLIGTLYVLAHFASNSEFTVMRAAGLSPAQAGRSFGSISRIRRMSSYTPSPARA